MAAPTYHLWESGCQMNAADALRAAALLERAGYVATDDGDHADFVLLSTCVIRQQAEDKFLRRMEQLAGQVRHRRLTVAVMGCFVGFSASQRAAAAARFPFVAVWMPPSDLAPLAAFLAGKGLLSGADAANAGVLPPSREKSAATAHVPVVLGCSHACTYCIVPYRRGPERSRDADEILNEVRSLAARGVREVTLLGQIVDRYGLDREGSILFPELLRRVAAVEGLRRVRFLTSHPNWMTDELIEVVATSEKICPAFEVPVQSGSDAVLERMRRGYRADDFRALVSRIRSRIPNASISTDIIVGFCGETEKDFEGTMRLMRDTQVDMIRIAKYSPRPLTYSARHLADDVPPEEKERRRVALDALLREMLTAKHAALAGTTGEILVESIEETEGRRHGRRRGRFPDGLLVFAENSGAQPGDVIPVRITVPGPYASIAEAI